MKTRSSSEAKSSKSKNVRTPADFNERDLSRGIYRPLCKRRPVDGGGDAVLLLRKSSVSDDYEMNDLPCDDYQRMHMT